MTTHTAITDYYAGATLDNGSLLCHRTTDATVYTASATSELNAGGGVYSAVFADVAAGSYRLKLKADGEVVATREVTFAGTDNETVQSGVRAELDSDVGDQITGIKAKTDNLPSDPADQSLIIAATDAVMTRLGAPAGASIAADIAAIDVGAGSSDWTTDERAAIRAILGIPASGTTPADPTTGILDNIRDLVVAYIAAALATVNGTSGTIVGFPATLNVGDSYTDDCNSSIHVFIRDESDDPITAVGTHDFTDGDFAPECIITQNGNTGRVKCEVEYVTASPESYLKIQIPSKESRRATPGIATVQVLLKWDGAQKVLSKQTVTWEALI
jgi:hypothetical protein